MTRNGNGGESIEEIPTVGYAGWSEWSARGYLREYYEEVCPDEAFLLEFLCEIAARIPRVPVALDYGCGPTVHRLFPLADRAGEVHLAEYLEENRGEVERWRRGDPDAHDWGPFAAETLRLQGLPAAPGEVSRLLRETRERITEVLPTDIRRADPLGSLRRASYALVTSHYCADGITADREEWRGFFRNIASLVRPGGRLLVSVIAGSYYTVGDLRFPSPDLTSEDLLAALRENGFRDVDLRERRVPDRESQGYDHVVFATGIRTADAPAPAPRRGGSE